MRRAVRPPLAWLAALALAGSGGALAATAVPPDALESAKAALRTRDYPSALAKLQRDAAGGNAEAQLLLGLVNLNGLGTPVDRSAATSWLSKSAAQNNATANYVLAAMAAQRSDAAPGEAQALLHKAASLGYPAAVEDVRASRLPMSPDWAGLSDHELRVDLAIYAVRNGDYDCLKALGADLKTLRDPFGASVLAHAVAAGALKSTQLLVDAGSDVNQADTFGVTPLMLAAQLEDLQILQLLLAKGAKPGALDKAQRSALFYAARADRPAAVKALVQAGARVDAVDAREYNALDAALMADADQAAAQLRSLGAKSQAAHAARKSNVGKYDAARPGDLYRGWPVVALAVARDDAASVQGLLAGGADADSRTAQGDSLLHVALHVSAAGTVKVLLAAHANPKQTDKRGRTVLVLAATRGDSGHRQHAARRRSRSG